MKFRSLVFSVLLVASVQAVAQEGRLSTSARAKTPPLSNYQLSPVVGYSNTGYSGIEGINGGNFKDLSFPSGGVGVLIGKGRWQFDTGLIYTTIGSEFTYASTLAGTRVVSKSSYLDVPLLARWTFSGNRRYRAFLRGGAVAGILIDSNVEQTISPAGLPTTTSNISDAFNSLDTRALIGVGGAYRLTATISLAASIDYQQGFTKLTNDKLYNGVEVHSRSLGASISLGMRL